MKAKQLIISIVFIIVSNIAGYYIGLSRRPKPADIKPAQVENQIDNHKAQIIALRQDSVLIREKMTLDSLKYSSQQNALKQEIGLLKNRVIALSLKTATANQLDSIVNKLYPIK